VYRNALTQSGCAILPHLAIHLYSLLTTVYNSAGYDLGRRSTRTRDHDNIARLTAQACHIAGIYACNASSNLKAFDDNELDAFISLG
jgi:hypothetical protein